MDHQHRDLLHWRADGGAEFYYHHARYARQGHDHDAHAADGVGLVHHRHSRTAGVRRASLGWHPAADGPEPWHQLFCAVGYRQRPAYWAQRCLAPSVAAPVLVLWTS